MTMLQKRCKLLVGVLAVALVLSGCGGDSSPSATTEADTPQANEQEREKAGSQEPAFVKKTPAGDVPTAPPPRDSTFDADGDGYMTNDEFCQAIDDSLESFTFPEGYVLNANDLCQRFTSGVPADSKHENGAEYAVIGRPHMCAWGQVWLAAFQQNDTSTMDIAMNQLETVTLTNPMFTYVKDVYAQAFAQAKLGDVANLRIWVGPNECDMSIFESTGEGMPESDLPGPPITKHHGHSPATKPRHLLTSSSTLWISV